MYGLGSTRITVIVILLLLAQAILMLSAWFENRRRPLMVNLHMLKKELENLHQCAKYYDEVHGLDVPARLLRPPESFFSIEIRRIERRLAIEAIIMAMIAMMPTGALAISLS
jgi:hypothetical protein